MRTRRYFVSHGSASTRRAIIIAAVLVLAAPALSPWRDLCPSQASASPAEDFGKTRAAAVASGAGIREVVPDKYRKKYLRWKAEYLSTEAGRRQWERYAADKNFTLTIVVSPKLGQGGVVNDYRWDASGKLVAATINLGSGFDNGIVSPFYYPVTGALAPFNEPDRVSGEILAAAKLAHEFGHVNLTAEADASSYRLQASLIDLYTKVFRETGYDKNDPRLAELARRMGGTPSDIKRGREHGAEANALVYLEERMSKGRGDAALFGRIRKYINEYGEGHLQLPK